MVIKFKYIKVIWQILGVIFLAMGLAACNPARPSPICSLLLGCDYPPPPPRYSPKTTVCQENKHGKIVCTEIIN